MLDWLPIDDVFITATSEPDAIDLIIQDHDSVKDLFDRFRRARDRKSKLNIARQAIRELKIHAILEEEIFYPAVRRQVSRDVMNEADEEHHVAKVLIAELEDTDGRDDHYDAKFNILAQNVCHHIKEEESDMLLRAHGLDIDLHELGREMLRRKKSLLAARKKAVPAKRKSRIS
jgi:hypothetical protein